MSILKAVMENGRLVLDEPTELPNGTVVELTKADPYTHSDLGDDLDDEERAALHASIERGIEQMKRGEGRSAEEFLAELMRRG